MPESWSYEQAIAWLNSRTNYEKKWPSYGPVTFNLERMRRLNALLGSPHERVPCIHITGTKGKGSTAMMLSSILAKAGLTVGLYTSPHLVDLEERIQLNGENIPKARLAELLQRTAAKVEFMRGIALPPHPTFFEIFTTAAFLYFAEEKADWTVLEVGLGGRLDSTNIVTPEIAVVTRVGLDHTNILGDTVREIAGEKAGIFKPGVPVVLGPQEERAERVLRGRAGAVNAEVWGMGGEIELGGVAPVAPGPGVAFDVKTPAAEYRGLALNLVGAHQAENAAVALGVLDMLRSRGKLAVSESAIREGLAAVRVPGRVEVMGRSPLVILDGAHNPMSIETLMQALRDHFTWRRLRLIFAMATDKDIPASLAIILPAADEVFFTTTNSPRAAWPEELAKLGRCGDLGAGLGKAQVHFEPDSAAAFREALSHASPDDLVLVTGSLYLAGDLRPVILKELASQPAR
jgi:dihydrofolate synthase/folylpolyglutamate synthase